MLKFDWDEGNIEKIAKRFAIPEIESFFEEDFLLFFDLKHSDFEELRFIAIGRLN